MMVIPMKWMPFLLTFTGIVTLVSGEVDVSAGLVMTAIGGIWLFFKYKK